LEVGENRILSHKKSSYRLQLEEHPSLLTLLPSSHCYPFIIFPSPHTILHIAFDNVIYLSLHLKHSDIFVELHKAHTLCWHMDVNGTEIFDEFTQDVTFVI
jgi:hypothetical protein